LASSVTDAAFAMTYVGKFIEAAGASVERARKILLLLVSTALITFAAYQSTSHTQLDKRIAADTRALQYGPAVSERVCQGVEPDRLDECRYAGIQWANIGDERERHHLRSDTAALRQVLADQIALLTAERKDVSERIKAPRKDVSERIKAPLFDFTFGAQDLWLYSDLLFVLLLIGAAYCMVSERHDIQAAFTAAKRVGVVGYCYEMLVTKQVLTVPESVNIPGRALWRILPVTLLLLPALVAGRNAWAVRNLLRHGADGTVGIAPSMHQLHWVLLLLNAVLSVIVIVLNIQYNLEWNQYAKDAERLLLSASPAATAVSAPAHSPMLSNGAPLPAERSR
jgi:hypothetical protein